MFFLDNILIVNLLRTRESVGAPDPVDPVPILVTRQRVRKWPKIKKRLENDSARPMLTRPNRHMCPFGHRHIYHKLHSVGDERYDGDFCCIFFFDSC